MNAMVPFRPQTKIWFSRGDLRGLPGVPDDAAHISHMFRRIEATFPDLCRPRVGRGGGIEVHLSALPAETQNALEAENKLDRLATEDSARAQAEADAVEDDKRAIEQRSSVYLSARQRTVMEARLQVLAEIDGLQAVLGKAGKDKAIRLFLTRLHGGELPPELTATASAANDKGRSLTRRTLYLWFKAREAGGISALAPEPTRKKGELPAWYRDFARFYHGPQKPALADALASWQRSLPPGTRMPTIGAVRRAIDKMDFFEKNEGRQSSLALRARRAYIIRDTSALLATDIYIADGKTFDAEIAHPIHGRPFRPELTSVLDVATRLCVGWSAALDESVVAVADAFRQACESHGVPAIFYTDRGPGYKNKTFDHDVFGLLARMGVTPLRALPKNAQAKGIIERFNHVWSKEAKGYPTFIGKDMDRDARQAVYKSTRKELATAGISRILPGWQQFLADCEAAVAAYNDRPHSGLPRIVDEATGTLRHQTPNEAWAAHQARGVELFMPSAAEAADMFRPYLERVVQRCMIKLFNNTYFSGLLERFEGKTVHVGYDIHDGSRVWVREVVKVNGELRQGGLICIAEFEGNKRAYVPQSFLDEKREKRAIGRLRRTEKHHAEIEAERRSAVLELRPAPVMPIIEAAVELDPITLEPVSEAPAPAASSDAAAGPDARPNFGTDEMKFIRWFAEDPRRLTPRDRVQLRELLSDFTTQMQVAGSGMDISALEAALDEHAA